MSDDLETLLREHYRHAANTIHPDPALLHRLRNVGTAAPAAQHRVLPRRVAPGRTLLRWAVPVLAVAAVAAALVFLRPGGDTPSAPPRPMSPPGQSPTTGMPTPSVPVPPGSMPSGGPPEQRAPVPSRVKPPSMTDPAPTGYGTPPEPTDGTETHGPARQGTGGDGVPTGSPGTSNRP